MNITDTRRINLSRWVAKNGIPAKEKSLFSQLKGDGSFGEKVARRLEKSYKMGDGFLDTPVDANAPVAELKPDAPFAGAKIEDFLLETREPMSAPWMLRFGLITEREARLLSWYRMSSDDGKAFIDTVASGTLKNTPSAVVDDQAQDGLARISGSNSE